MGAVGVFEITPDVRRQVREIVDERIREAHVSREDFSELKNIVRDLAKAQQRTEARMEQLAEAQQRTEIEVRKLAKSLRSTRTEVGGLSRSMSYALENEAYRVLPGLLKERYGIEVFDRFVRTEIAGEEVNVFGKGRRDGREVWIVGEVELKLTGVGKFRQLARKVSAVREEYGDVPVVEILLTHFARSQVLERAKEKGIIVIQSFEW